MSVLITEGSAAVNSTTNPLDHTMNASDVSQILNDDPVFPSSGNNNIFFIFPAMGFIVLIMGSLYLRHRRIEQSQESARAYDARLRAHHDCIQLKKALRLEMVESALVTTKVVVRSQKSNTRRSSFALTESTLDLSNSSQDSEIDASIEDVEAQAGFAEPASPMTLERPLDMDGWKLESCAICLEPYQENDSVSYSKHQNCSHAFHTECILNWLQDEYRNDCPCCRSQYVHACITEPEEDDDIFAGEAVADGPDVLSSEDQAVNTNMTSEQSILTTDEEQAIANRDLSTDHHS